MKLRYKWILFFAPTLIFCGSCKKFVTVNAPITELTGANVYTTDATAAAVLTGLYANMSTGTYSFETGQNSISLKSGLSADELTVWPGSTNTYLIQFYQNALTNQQGLTFWEGFYSCLLQINSAVEGLAGSSSLTPAVKKQLTGEAKFMRAFCYFYLVNLYGDVPLVTGTNYQINASLSRTPAVTVWQQIVEDLYDAQDSLSANYLDGTILKTTTERTRPTSWAATALLARSYLYKEKWDSAEIEATLIINNSVLYSLDTLNGVFLKNSTEAIWQLQPTQSGFNTMDAETFILPSAGPSDPSYPVYMSNFLLSTFETGDQRRLDWVDSVTVGSTIYYFPYKYKQSTYGEPLTEYLMVLRLAEQYLIRAEAEAELGDLSDAANDLNMIRTRAGLPNVSNTIAASQTALLSAILHERQVEFFTEWGHRWLDLKRTNNANAVLGTPGNVCAAKGGVWNPDWQLYPLPLYDLQQDINLVQNPGY